MTIATRSDLESAIDNWLARTDITQARKLEFMTMFEAAANRRLRVRSMEASTTLTTTSGAATLPSDLLEVRTVTWEGSTTMQLEYMVPTEFRGHYPTTDTGDPEAFTIEGSTINIRPVDDTTSITFRYYQSLTTIITASSTYNWLLTNHPDCYLAGCLFEAQVFLANPEAAMLWMQKRDAIFSDIERADKKVRGSVAIRPLGTVV